MRLPLCLCYIKDLNKLAILVYSSLLLFWSITERTDVLAACNTRETELVSCRIGLWDHFFLKKGFWPRILRNPVIADNGSNSVRYKKKIEFWPGILRNPVMADKRSDSVR